MIRETTFKSGSKLFQQGEIADFAYLIRVGQVTNYRETLNGPVELETVDRYGIVGEAALLDGGPRSCTAVAVGDVGCIALDAEAFKAAMADCPKQMSVAIGQFLDYLRWALPDDGEPRQPSAAGSGEAERIVKLVEKTREHDFQVLISNQSAFIRGVFRSVVAKATARLGSPDGPLPPT